MSAVADPWEYLVHTIKMAEVATLSNELNRLGAEGWELVSMAPTTKTLVVTGNDLVAVFKRPGRGAFVEDRVPT